MSFGSRHFLTLYKSSSKDVSHPPLPEKLRPSHVRETIAIPKTDGPIISHPQTTASKSLVSFRALVTSLAALSSDSLQQLKIDFNLDFYGFRDEPHMNFRSTPTPRKQARPRTTNRYPFSDSDEDKTDSSMDSTAPTSPLVDAVDDGSSTQFPRRLFALGFFPTGLRLNIYSKANVIGAVASALADCFTYLLLVAITQLSSLEASSTLDEVEDLQVTRLVHCFSSGHTFTTEDFRGGEKSFRIRGKQHRNAPVPPEDKPEVVPIIQRNLRLRKPAAVVVEDLTSLNITNPRSLINQELQNMDRGIYERLKTMERNICCHLGVSPPNVHNTLKMKADDDNHGLSDSPKTVGIQKQWPPRKSRRASSTVTKPTKKIHSYPLRSADGLQGNIGRTPPYFNKESGADYDCAHDRTPPFDEHVNYQEPCTPYAVPDESNSENPVTTVTVYNPLIFVRPQSYVSPTKSGIDQPPCIIPACETPPSAAYPDSVPNLPSQLQMTWNLFPEKYVLQKLTQ
ncbi:hypothetical protein HID58_087797, partial [Brassica napus]